MSLLPKKSRERGAGAVSSLRHEVNRLFDNFFEGMEFPSLFRSPGFAPLVDVLETPEAIQVKAEIPGIDPKDLNISLSGDVLTIKGEKKTEREERDKNYHLMERSYGSFTRTVALPPYADRESVSAESKDGVLTIRIGKLTEAKPKSIQVKVT